MNKLIAQSEDSKPSLKSWDQAHPPWQNPYRESSDDHQRLLDSTTYEKRQEINESWVSDMASLYRWDEMVTCTFKAPMLNAESAQKMFRTWLHNRYLDHAVKVGQATMTVVNKLDAYGQPAYQMSKEWVKGDLYPPTDDLYAPPRDYLDHWVPVQKAITHTKYKGRFINAWKNSKNLKPVYMLATERHKSGGYHLHGLVHHRVFQEDISRIAGWESWHGARGHGRVRIEPPKDQKEARSYVTKAYTVKQGDITLSESFKKKCQNKEV